MRLSIVIFHTFFSGYLVDELNRIKCTFINKEGDVICGMVYFFSPDTTFQHTLNIIFALVDVNGSWTIDKIYPFGEGDILPYFGLAWDRGSFAYSFLFQRIYHTWFAYIGITNETNADIFLITVEDVKLSE